MTGETTIETEQPRIFNADGTPATDTCLRCGYSLRGLPSNANCPECGHACRDDVIAIYGSATGTSHATLANARGRALIWPVAAIALCVYGPLQQAILTQRWLEAVPMLGFWGACVAYAVAARRATRHPGLVQVRLNEAACIQHNDMSGPSMVKDLAPLLSVLFAGLWFAASYRSMSSAGGMLGLAVALIFISVIWLVNRVRLRRAAREPRFVGLRDDWQRGIPTLWHNAGDVTIEKTSAGLHVLRVRKRRRQFRITFEAVNGQFLASDADVERLRAFVAGRKSVKETDAPPGSIVATDGNGRTVGAPP